MKDTACRTCGEYEGTIGRDALVRVLRPRRDLPKNTPLGEELPFHRISVGDMVILSDNEVERVTLEDINVYGSEEGTSSSSSIVRHRREQTNVLFNYCNSRGRFRGRVEGRRERTTFANRSLREYGGVRSSDIRVGSF